MDNTYPIVGSRQQASAYADMIIENLPNGVQIALSNDPGPPDEAYWQGPDFRGDWAMGGNSDGAVLINFPVNESWEITIRDVTFMGDLDKWSYQREDTANLYLDPSKDVVIRFVPPFSIP